MDGVLLAGRILFAASFLLSGFGHFAQYKVMVGYARQAGAPLPEVTVPATGALIVIGSVLFALGIWADLAALLLAGFLVPTTVIMHRFWRLEVAQMAAIQQAYFIKNIALVGAALAMFAFFQQFGSAVGLTLTDPLFK